MNIVLNLILLGVGFISFLPVVSFFKSPKDQKYRCLKYLMYTTFSWSILIFIERLVETPNIIYYAHMLGYPIKFLLAVFLLCTVYHYVEKKFPRVLYYFLGGIFLVELGVALTNNTTNYFLQLSVDQTMSYKDLYSANNGTLFMYHLVMTYLLVVIAVTFLVVFLTRNKNVRHYRTVTRTLMYSSFIVLTFNLLQLFTPSISVDLTYISLVIVTYALYQVIYHKDMIFNLKSSGRGEILSNMREMYIITDRERIIVDISQLLQKKYNVTSNDFIGKPLNNLLDSLEEHIVFYQERDVDSDSNPNKDHFHLREKKFTLKGINDYGYMILLYDETQVFKLLRELNQLSNYDNMTGLHNRNFIENYLKEVKPKENVSVISLDLNGLKANNDYLGHERGDFLLKSLASKIKEVMSKYDENEIARVGGDEFLIILKNKTQDTLKGIKEAILQLCDATHIIDKISVSIGVAQKESDTETVYQLIKRADEDMYKMKEVTSRAYSKEIVKYATNKDEYIR